MWEFLNFNIQLNFLSNLPVSRKECQATKKGNGKNPKDCIFPFKWKSIKYETCTKVDAEKNDKAWCAIKVNNKNVVKKNHRWICEDGCPGIGEKILITTLLLEFVLIFRLAADFPQNNKLYHRLRRLFMSRDQNNYYANKLPTLIKFIVLWGTTYINIRHIFLLKIFVIYQRNHWAS